jgi:hypothetical protein
MVQELIKHYLTDLSWDHKKPVKEGHKEDDSLSSQDESDSQQKKDTLDDGLLDAKHDRSNFEWSANYTQKRIVEAKDKIKVAIEKKEDEHVLQGARDEYQRLTRDLGCTLKNHVHLF